MSEMRERLHRAAATLRGQAKRYPVVITPQPYEDEKGMRQWAYRYAAIDIGVTDPAAIYTGTLRFFLPGAKKSFAIHEPQFSLRSADGTIRLQGLATVFPGAVSVDSSQAFVAEAEVELKEADGSLNPFGMLRPQPTGQFNTYDSYAPGDLSSTPGSTGRWTFTISFTLTTGCPGLVATGSGTDYFGGAKSLVGNISTVSGACGSSKVEGEFLSITWTPA